LRPLVAAKIVSMGKSPRGRLLGLVAGVVIVLFLLHVHAPLPSTTSLPPIFRTRPSNDEIPNIVHYAWTQRDTTTDLALEFKHFLSIYAARLRWKPTDIYLHTNANATTVARARRGFAGKWSKLIFTLPGLQIRHVEAPTHALNGERITCEEHKTDFLRADILHDMGGVYIDWDVYAMRDITPLRRTGFNAVVGRIEGRQLQVNSGALLSKKGSLMSSLYQGRMHQVYNGKYTTHSNILLTGLCERLSHQLGEVLILDQNAFTPGSWLPKDLYMLYEVHTDVRSNLDGIRQGDEMQAYDEEEEPKGSWDRPESLSESWERHFFDSYMIHAFQPGVRNIGVVEGFDNITPRYVLERRSNFARALYSVVKDMYDRGIVDIDDPFDGRS
jgi:hypothetical protein